MWARLSQRGIGIGLASRLPDLRLPLLLPGTLSYLLLRARAPTTVAAKRESARACRRCLRTWRLLHYCGGGGVLRARAVSAIVGNIEWKWNPKWSGGVAGAIWMVVCALLVIDVSSSE